MAYTVLARRYRSNTFDQVVGQNHIAQTLKKAIHSGRIAHAYLFCGTRGTGKTSTARILAKCLNCQSSDHAVIEPCNTCDSCKSIAKGDDIDVIEIDAASNTGVDNVRDIIIGTAYNMPARSRFKVFIIDEVHMLSKQAFNALLKTLEEPPSHVKFILATTEPEKVLPTILSRCQRYDFRNIPTREISDHLKSICKAEKIQADDDALLLVAKSGAGSMRDSLSLLDRLLSNGETRLSVNLLEEMLGLPKSQLLFELVAAIAGQDVQSVLSQADKVISDGLAVDTLIASLIDHLRNLMLLRTCGSKSDLVEVPGLSLVDLATQAEQFDPGALSQDIVILEELRRHVRQSQAGRALLDATLVRMTLADQFSSINDLVERASGKSGADQKKKSEVSTGSSLRPNLPKVIPDQSTFPSALAPTPIASETTDEISEADDDLPAPGKIWEGPRESLGAMMAKQAIALKEPPNIEPVVAGDLSDKWKAMLGLLAEHGPALGGLLQHGQLIRIDDGRAVIRYAAQHETNVKLLERNGKKDLVRDALSMVLDQPVGVLFEIGDQEHSPQTQGVVPSGSIARKAPATAPIPAMVESSNSIRLTEEIRASLYKSDSLIKAVIDQLGGSIIKLEEL